MFHDVLKRLVSNSTVVSMAFNLIAMASNLRTMASTLQALLDAFCPKSVSLLRNFVLCFDLLSCVCT